MVDVKVDLDEVRIEKFYYPTELSRYAFFRTLQSTATSLRHKLYLELLLAVTELRQAIRQGKISYADAKFSDGAAAGIVGEYNFKQSCIDKYITNFVYAEAGVSRVVFFEGANLEDVRDDWCWSIETTRLVAEFVRATISPVAAVQIHVNHPYYEQGYTYVVAHNKIRKTYTLRVGESYVEKAIKRLALSKLLYEDDIVRVGQELLELLKKPEQNNSDNDYIVSIDCDSVVYKYIKCLGLDDFSLDEYAVIRLAEEIREGKIQERIQERRAEALGAIPF